MPNAAGQGLRRLRAVGRRRQAARARRGQAHAARRAVGQQQAKLYADCLEAQFGQRPVIFYSNGYEHWLWDDASYPPRQVQGFYKKDELELLIQRRTTRRAAGRRPTINEAIVERYYQTRAHPAHRRGLRAGPRPQGAGGDGDRRGQDPHRHRPVRPADALQLGQARALPGRPRRAGESGGERLQDAPARCVAGEPRHREGRRRARLRLDLSDDDGADRRDAATGSGASVSAISISIVIDEAHRSVYQKYRAIFDYFDSLLVGLTATPKDEVDRNTYSLFDLENGVPTDAYSARRSGATTASSCRRRPCRCRSSSSARASRTTTCPKRRRTSGTRWSGTRRATCPTASRPRRSTSGCSTRTPWTRCWST